MHVKADEAQVAIEFQLSKSKHRTSGLTDEEVELEASQRDLLKSLKKKALYMSQYRPEGWENPYKILSDGSEFHEGLPIYDGSVECDILKYKAFEAGADAMLEALKKPLDILARNDDITPEHYEKGEEEEIWIEAPCNGTLVFIPDEVKNEIP